MKADFRLFVIARAVTRAALRPQAEEMALGRLTRGNSIVLRRAWAYWDEEGKR